MLNQVIAKIVFLRQVENEEFWGGVESTLSSLDCCTFDSSVYILSFYLSLRLFLTSILILKDKL